MRKCVLTCGLAVLLVVAPVSATATAIEDEIGGLLTNRTITRFGQQFYQAFSHEYGLLDTAHSVGLVIQERPSARWGSLIWIEGNNQRLYQLFWQPGKNGIEAMAQRAVEQVTERLYQQRVEQLLSDHFDLDRDEL